MPHLTAAFSTNSQGGPADRNVVRQTGSVRNENATSVRRQILPQELDLNYYRKFLGDLVTVMRDAKTDSVARLVLLIRSGASNGEIHAALQRVQNGS
ncbi:hypothetical protein N7489_003605 [Penicillium chrysogenum]|uniref:Uncharacterized protein n=1 Tax=Penicillium chrysogenum TaxID=5076 RepID=A0ABQ8WA38_PENCH|nr:uncharacterized protein N7489_003605 [Penicillium chrysogenum]KAJ5253195.1 hypothetical protein N7489_003605 [Penicillium chrysogenum]KAJ5260416.1 hypothetical protein N7505_009797 [Penicillium chrysogenum]KAJ6137026.1 hypothetical protein N7497_012278 [Penicillium chrysogenum]